MSSNNSKDTKKKASSHKKNTNSKIKNTRKKISSKVKESQKKMKKRKVEAKKNIRKKINSIHGKPKLKKTLNKVMNGVDYIDKHASLKGAIAAALAVGTVMLVDDIANPKYQVSYVNEGTAVVEKGGHVLTRANGEDYTRKDLFGKVSVKEENGEKSKIPYADITVLSNSFSKNELDKYEVVYRLTGDQPLRKKNNIGKVITNLPKGTTVIGKSSSMDGTYTIVHTDNGLTGCVLSDHLKQIMTIPKKEEKRTPKKKTSESTIGKSGYVVVNGEVLGIDVNTSAVNLTQFEEILSGARKHSPIGSISNTKVNHVYIKIGGFGYKSHNPVWNSNDYNIYMDKIVKMIDICKKYDVPYGFYFYSTAVDKQDAIKEADLINKKMDYFRERGVESPILPLALNVELNDSSDKQRSIYRGLSGKAREDSIAKASIARAEIFNRVLAEHGDYISMSLYTNQAVTTDHDNSKVLDLSVLADHIDGMETLPIWWVSQLGANITDISGQKIDGITTPKGKKIHIYGKQIAHDTPVEGSFLVDYSIIYEDDFKSFLRESGVTDIDKPNEGTDTDGSELSINLVGELETPFQVKAGMIQIDREGNMLLNGDRTSTPQEQDDSEQDL